jgi:hypothetical protein
LNPRYRLLVPILVTGAALAGLPLLLITTLALIAVYLPAPNRLWGLRLHMLATLHGLPVGFALTGDGPCLVPGAEDLGGYRAWWQRCVYRDVRGADSAAASLAPCSCRDGVWYDTAGLTPGTHDKDSLARRSHQSFAVPATAQRYRLRVRPGGVTLIGVVARGTHHRLVVTPTHNAVTHPMRVEEVQRCPP